VRRRESFARLSRALQQLHMAESVDQLAEQVPGQVADLGFNRTMFSWVEQARWVPQAYHTGNGPEEARAVMAAGLPPYWHTRDLLEGEMVRHKLPILVRDALGHPRVHRDIQAVMHSRSYVAAPLVRRAQVVGFVHADQNVDTGAVDEVDRDVVSLFADGLVLAIDRVRALEEFAALRSRMSVQKSTLLELIAEFDGANPAQGPARSERDADRPPRRHVSPDWSEVLTRREEQVLGLIADGLNNSQIAERLYITEGTAKTHVKHVLRKLGADNRAQAAARFRQG
jgi:DNA-binding NarL/FixJ family response regulator